MDNKAKCRSKI